jgi:hypothetical protein
MVEKITKSYEVANLAIAQVEVVFAKAWVMYA